MLGEIVGGLTNADMAENVIATIGKPEILARVRDAAATDDVPVGALVAFKVRDLLEHGSEDIWLDLICVMSGVRRSRVPQPSNGCSPARFPTRPGSESHGAANDAIPPVPAAPAEECASRTRSNAC